MIKKCICSSRSDLTIETLKRETEVTDEQLASVEETDLPKSSSHSDNTDDYVEIQTDIAEEKARTAMNRTQAGINDSSVKLTNQEVGTSVTGGDISPSEGNYSKCFLMPDILFVKQ